MVTYRTLWRSRLGNYDVATVFTEPLRLAFASEHLVGFNVFL